MTVWTEDRIAKLRKLTAEGLSASAIAYQLACGLSRNAVLGKQHRMHLVRSTVRRRASRTKPRRIIKPTAQRPVIVAAPIAPVDDIARVSFQDLDSHHCRFIPGDPKSHPSHVPIYCGDTRMPGSPYCAGHHHRCSVPIVRPARPYRPGAPYVSVNSRILEDA